jgi:hypothetical protein
MTAATDPSSWPRTGWCWGCGPTRRPIAPNEISELESCVDHLPPGWRREHQGGQQRAS